MNGMPPAALVDLAMAQWALDAGDDAAFYDYRSRAFDAMEAAGLSLTEALALDVQRHHEAREMAAQFPAMLRQWNTHVQVVATCTGDHLPGPRRIAGPRVDWCVWCEAPIWLENGR